MVPEDQPAFLGWKEWLKISARIWCWIVGWKLLVPPLDPDFFGWLFIGGFILTEYLFRRFTKKNVLPTQEH